MQSTNSSTDGSTGSGMLDRVRQTATSQLSQQKDRATDGLGSLAQSIRESSRSFRDKQQDTIAQYAERAADRIEQFSSRLRERDLADLVRDAEQFARRQPAVFIGATFAAGVLAARFLKSSARDRTHAGMGTGGPSSAALDRLGTVTDEPGPSLSARYSRGDL
jgi:ElaB/YqjD/DUF883 family membrane-anchored ribosome-binding protein